MAFPLTIRQNQFFVESKNTIRSHTLLHVTEIKNDREAELKGSFFAIFEIEQGNSRLIEYAQDFIAFIEKFYYEEFAGERNHFEDTMLHANQLLRGFETPSNTGIHAVMGLVRGNALLFCTHGKPGIWLFSHGTKRAHSLIDVPREEKRDPNDSFFSELNEGTLSIQDITIFASTHLEDYFTPDRLTKIVHGHDSSEIARHLERTLRELESGLAFAGLVLEGIPASPAKPPAHAVIGSHASVVALLAGQKKTAEFLTPTIFKNAWEWLDDQWQARPGAHKRTPKTPPSDASKERPRRGNEELLLGHLLWYLVRNLTIFLWRMIRGIVLFLLRGGAIILTFIKSSRDDRIALRSAFSSKTKGRFARWYARFRTLPARQQVLLATIIVGIVLALGGSGTVLYNFWHTRQENERAALVRQIIKNHEEAEAKMIYGADGEARALLIEAQRLVAQLPKRSRVHKTERAELEGIVGATLAELRKEIFVDVKTIAAIAPDALPIPRFLGAFPNNFVVTSDNAPRAIFIHRENTVTRDITLPEPFRNPANDIENTILFQGANTLYRVKEDGTATAVLTSATSTRDFAVFNNRLYTLQPDQEQIMAHARRNDVFTNPGTAWIKETTVLPLDAVHLIIDGDMYVLNNTGSVQKFHRGASVPLVLVPIDPVLRTVTRAWTNDESNSLYILDAEIGRVIVFDKEGKLKAQYRNDMLKDATDLVVDEPGKRIFLAGKDGIQQFELMHIQ